MLRFLSVYLPFFSFFLFLSSVVLHTESHTHAIQHPYPHPHPPTIVVLQDGPTGFACLTDMQILDQTSVRHFPWRIGSTTWQAKQRKRRKVIISLLNQLNGWIIFFFFEVIPTFQVSPFLDAQLRGWTKRKKKSLTGVPVEQFGFFSFFFSSPVSHRPSYFSCTFLPSLLAGYVGRGELNDGFSWRTCAAWFDALHCIRNTHHIIFIYVYV